MHLLIDIEKANPSTLTIETVREFLVKLPDTIGMTKLLGPLLETHGDLVMGIMVIAESHISVHADTRSHQVFIDVFSCREFDQDMAAELARKTYGGWASSRALDRGIGFLHPSPEATGD